MWRPRYLSRGQGPAKIVRLERCLVVEVAGSNLTEDHLQATFSKLLTYGVLRSTQPSTLRGTGNE